MCRCFHLSEHFRLPQADIVHIIFNITFDLVCVHAPVPMNVRAGVWAVGGHTCGGYKIACRNQVSPSTVWIPRTEVRPSRLETSTFTSQAILSAQLAGNLKTPFPLKSFSTGWLAALTLMSGHLTEAICHSYHFLLLPNPFD